MKRDIGPLTIRAAMRPGSVNKEKRTVDVSWSKGSPVLRSNWSDGQFYEELSMDAKSVRMDRLSSGRAPLLDSHASYGGVGSVLGVVESARIQNGEGTATVRFPSEGVSAESDKVFRLIEEGIVQNVSVGYRTYKFEKTEGGSGSIPTYRATDWEPYEISAVPMGADATSSFRAADLNSCEFVEKRTMENETPAAKPAAVPNDETRQIELKAAAEAAAKTERERGNAIRALVRKHKSLDQAFADDLVAKGTSVDEARAAILDKLATASESIRIDPPSIAVGEESREKFLRGAESALLVRNGQGSLVAEMQKRGHEKFKGIDLDPGEFRAMSPVSFARRYLEQNNVRTLQMSDADIVGRAFTFNRQGEQSISDFSVLLENVMYKTLLGNYVLADDTWRMFCKVDTVQDFRASNRYRTGSFGTLPQVLEGAEFTNAVIPDGLKQTLSVQTYGKMLALTRQAVVNDDMGAILDTAGKFGRSAGLSIEASVYALLTANSGLGFLPDGSTPFFDSSLNANVNSTGSAMGVQGMDADRVVLASQKDISSNEYLNLAKFGRLTLLVPISLGGLARNVMKSEWDITQSSKFQVPNIVQGLAKVVDTPRLTGTRRYLFADPGDAAAIVVAFLQGLESPFMEQKLGWRVDGTEWKIRLDYGVQWFDPKGAVTNAGA